MCGRGREIKRTTGGNLLNRERYENYVAGADPIFSFRSRARSRALEALRFIYALSCNILALFLSILIQKGKEEKKT